MIYGGKQAFYLHTKDDRCVRNILRGRSKKRETITVNVNVQDEQNELVEQVKMLTKELSRLKGSSGSLPPGGIYIIQTGMCFALDNNVYKVGSTGAGFSKRFSQYEKGAKEICFQLCDKFQSQESQLLGLFREQFTQRKDFGTEFFEEIL